MSRRKRETWLALLLVAIGLIPAALVGLWGFMSATAPRLHPIAKDIRSVPLSEPMPAWTDPVNRAREIVRAALAEQNLPGLSAAVGVGGDMVWAEGFGWADLEQRLPVAPDTKFRIGTASTALTSAAVGLLMERKRLNLDDEIQTYVPEFPRKQWPVTVRQLMGHVAGMRDDGGDEGPLFSQHCGRPIEALQFFDELALRSEPATEYHYSSYGWILVSAAVEAAARQPFVSFLGNEVFEPLGMRDTEAESSTGAIARRATSYFPRFAADPRYGLHLMRAVDYSCYSGSSVFVSTPSDLVRFGMAINAGQLLQPATVRLLQTSQRLTSGQETGYGLGWDLESVSLTGNQTYWAGHDGMLLGGMAASLITFPNHGLVVSVVSNISYADTEAVALKLAEAFVAGAKRPSTSG